MSIPGSVQDPSAVEAREIDFESAGGTMISGYLAWPARGKPSAGIIVIHEAFGLNDHIRDIARRFANIGYLALAPDLYSRAGLVDPKDMEEVTRAMFGLPDAQAVADLGGALAFLRSQPGITRAACIGFCSGGRQSLLFAFSGAPLDAAVACWGGYIRRATPDALTTPQRPTPVVDLSDGLRAPLYAAFGAEDQNPSPEDSAELARRLAGKQVTVRTYEGAGHAFFADYRPNYREKPAHILWQDVTAFFHENLSTAA